MKKPYALLLAVLLIAVFVHAQVPFNVGYHLRDRAGQNNFGRTADNGFILSYQTSPTFAAWGGPLECSLIKLDSAGAQQWVQSFPLCDPQLSCIAEPGNSVAQLHDGGYIVATNYYTYNPTGSPESTAYLVRTDSAGNILWSGLYPGEDFSTARCVKETQDHGFIVCGDTYADSSGSGLANAFLFRTDSAGNLQWGHSFRYNLQGNYMEGLNAVIETSTGDFVACGNVQANGFMIKTDAAGVELWSLEFGIVYYLSDVQELPGGDYLTVGANSYTTGIYKISAGGTGVWSRGYVSDNHSRACSFVQTWDGFTIACRGGMSDGTVSLVHMDHNGNRVWSRSYFGGFGDLMTEVQQVNDGGYVFTSHFESNTSGDWAIVVTKTDSLGMSVCGDSLVPDTVLSANVPFGNLLAMASAAQTDTITTAVTPVVLPPTWLCLITSSGEAQPAVENVNVYPNPANDRITIQTSFASYERTRIRLCDIAGRTVFEDELRSDRQEIDISALNTGVYIILVETNGVVTAQKRMIRN